MKKLESLIERRDYTKIIIGASRKKMNVSYSPLSSTKKFYDRFKFNGKVLDFGCGLYLQKDFYHKTVRDRGEYYAYDVDTLTINEIKARGYYEDFWNTTNKFDTIILSHVYEHLNRSLREKTLARTHEILNDDGTIIIEFPYYHNLNGIIFWKDSTHMFPPAPRDVAMLSQMIGFKSEIYLLGLCWFPLRHFSRLILNIILGFYPQRVVIIVLKKEAV